MSFVEGYALCLDMTDRALQEVAKAERMPWTLAKGMDTFCPVSRAIPASELPNPHDIELWLTVDGEERQRASTALMLFPIPRLISAISAQMSLRPGDLILTGTPSGVGPVEPGSVMRAGLGGLLSMEIGVRARD
eukprot:NODE_3340_length_784_cov_102.254422_g2791_i0.p2 GENE.NODE_3340_length_784_cov_102.254422_g2791_i0~~NODE_3340_length_784_cov_102.254422_g2791_i0.p2  ORF type:complete len:134 (-),score=29.92 NODE_3340_length_784_cov_102.254422_g2791_i0:62-463(-)